MGRKHCEKHGVFKGLVLQTHKNQGLFGKGLRPVELAISEVFTFPAKFSKPPAKGDFRKDW